MQRLQGFINWIAVTSEISHFFCCGIPILFSIVSLLVSLGLTATMPIGLDSVHHAMHHYEIPMIMVSAIILILGWSLHYIAYRIDCRSTGCVHEPCKPKKKRSGTVLIVATVLFAANVTGYFALHA